MTNKFIIVTAIPAASERLWFAVDKAMRQLFYSDNFLHRQGKDLETFPILITAVFSGPGFKSGGRFSGKADEIETVDPWPDLIVEAGPTTTARPHDLGNAGVGRNPRFFEEGFLHCAAADYDQHFHDFPPVVPPGIRHLGGRSAFSASCGSGGFQTLQDSTAEDRIKDRHQYQSHHGGNDQASDNAHS